MDPRSCLTLLQSSGHLDLIKSPAPGKRKHGAPPGGPWDPEAWAMAQALTGAEAGWESLSPQPGSRLRVRADQPLVLAVLGEGGWVKVGPMEARTSALALLAPGAEAEVGSDHPVRLLLACGPAERIAIGLSRLDWPLPPASRLPFFGPDGMILAGPISHQISRVGLRITGAGPSLPSLEKSEPSILGAIQATPSGEILIHGPEGPTIGGYPKLGRVGPWALGQLSRLPPGSPVELVGSWEEARAFERGAEAFLSSRLPQLHRLRGGELIHSIGFLP